MFDPDQPRDADGQWVDVPGLGGSAGIPDWVSSLVESVGAYNIQPLNEWSSHMNPDSGDAEALANSMREHGWQGAPVLSFEGQAVTGTHRIAAAREAGINVETLDLSDLIDNAPEAYETVRSDNDWADGPEIIGAIFKSVLGDDLAEELGLDLDVDAIYVDEDVLGSEHAA